ncbi:interferon alpha-inducible protein 27-like protein 1 [Pipistrellus kuhlii]|uniref:interferon alpha-inducible protein 27-like protein 1 n=1 Tax=Pipistrellus kuhlii TaxID=59472 RepID=UPI001E273F88|nr:interferon alpha-inducible protein 27-like protein 1 [Pipistrellus kuhlii]
MVEEEEEPSQPSSAGSTPGVPPPGPPSGPPMWPWNNSKRQSKDKKSNFASTAGKVGLAVLGGVVAVGAVPVVLGAIGFTSTGIAASSIAANMMSSAAIANGGGVAAGSLVATLQSVGAAGLSLSSKILLGATGSSIGAWMWRPFKNNSDKIRIRTRTRIRIRNKEEHWPVWLSG